MKRTPRVFGYGIMMATLLGYTERAACLLPALERDAPIDDIVRSAQDATRDRARLVQ